MAGSKEIIAELGKKTQFSKNNQPDPKNISKGMRKKFSWDKAKREMWDEFIVAIAPDGEEVNVPEQQLKRWQKLLLGKTLDKNGKKVGYTDDEKDELMFKIVDKILPKETKLTGDDDSPLSISVNLVKNDKKA